MDGDDQDGGVTMVIKCSGLEKKKGKNRRFKAKVQVLGTILFW
jgi:hypothetical protein